MDKNIVEGPVWDKLRRNLEAISSKVRANEQKFTFSIHPSKLVDLLNGKESQSISSQTSLEDLTTELENLNIKITSDASSQTDESLLIPEIPNSSRVLPNWLKNINVSNDSNSTMLNRDNTSKRKNEDHNNMHGKKAKIDPKPVPFVFNDRAIKNLTNVDIPQDVLLLLSFGPKFIPPVCSFDKVQVLSDLSKLKNCSKSVVSNEAYRNTLDMVLKYRRAEPSWRQTQINNLVSLSEAFKKAHPELRIDVSDKGNITVIMYNEQYREKVLDKLLNNEAYAPMLLSEHTKLMKKNYTLLLRCAEEQFVPHSSVLDHVAGETQFSQMYGLIKAHKPDDNFPVRLINANVNVVGNKLSSIILPILNKMNSSDPFYIPNSNQLVHKLKKIRLQKDDMIFSLDIVDMFTNIPVKDAWDLIELLNLKDYTNMSPGLFKSIFDFITMEATEFKFEDKLFKMVKGLPMGVSTSPVIACLVTSKLLLDTLALVKPVTFICKYVDDILIITNKENASRFFDILNKHPSLKFKLETEENSMLNYLDLTILRKEDCLETKWYCKPYASHRLINWFSGHDKQITINTAINFVKNMLNLTSPIYKEEIEFLAFDILKKNSFPESVVKTIISNINQDKYPRDVTNPQYVGTYAPLDLMISMNSALKHKIHGQDVRFVNKSFANNLANKLYSSRKEDEDFNYRNYMVLELSCKDCKFVCISPVIYPIVLFNVFGLNYEKHPYWEMQKHIASTKHANNYNIEILRVCDNKDETLRLAEMEGTVKGLNVHSLARKSNVEIVRKNCSRK